MNPLLPPFLWPSEEAREETSRRITLLEKQNHGLKVSLLPSVLNTIPQSCLRWVLLPLPPAACSLCPVWKIRSVSPTPTLVCFVSQTSQPYWQSKTIIYKANQHFEHFFLQFIQFDHFVLIIICTGVAHKSIFKQRSKIQIKILFVKEKGSVHLSI